MKKMILAAGAIVAAAIVTSCAGITTNNGMPAPAVLGMNLFSNISLNSMIADVQSTDYKVVKHGAHAEGTITSFFGAINMGDASFETLKKEAVGADADDLIDVRVDYKMNCICGINTVTVKLTGTAIKYKK